MAPKKKVAAASPLPPPAPRRSRCRHLASAASTAISHRHLSRRPASTRTFGYVVRVGHRQSAKGWRPKFKAYFGDFSNGGKKNALAAAVKWLKTLEKTGKHPRRNRY